MSEDWENELTAGPSITEKLSALRSIINHLPEQGEMNERGFNLSASSMLIIMSPRSTNHQRAACSIILDYCFPEWREHLSIKGVGAVAGRNSSASRKWRNEVLRSDGYQCVDCGSDKELEAHHIVRWADNVFLRVDVTNGKTLCKRCHLATHGRLH